MTTKWQHTGRDHKDDNDYASPHPDLETAAASSDLKPVIPFDFWGKEVMVIEVRYDKLVFTVFAQCYLLVIFHW